MKYEVDPYNRIVLRDTGTTTDLPRFRKVIDGRFRVDKNNNLSYHVKTPVSDADRVPRQFKLKGTWSLTSSHELKLTLDKTCRKTFGEQIIIKGEILDVTAGSLLFSAKTRTKDSKKTLYVIRLGGVWKADKYNRLSFYVQKEKSRHDILTFTGMWDINKSHQIIYKYEKAVLIRKKKDTHTLTFKGYWDINDKGRIRYVLNKKKGSCFGFEISGGIFNKKYIKYEIGIRSNRLAKSASRVVTLFGRWKIKKNVGLVFEVQYSGQRIHAIGFKTEARLTNKDTVLFRIKNNIDGKDTEASLKLSHKILSGDGEAFLRILQSKKDRGIYAGIALKW